MLLYSHKEGVYMSSTPWMNWSSESTISASEYFSTLGVSFPRSYAWCYVQPRRGWPPPPGKGALYRKSDLFIPRNETARPISQCFCEGLIYSQDRSAYLAAAKNADRSWENINCSQIHQCGNWESKHYNSVLEITRPCAVSFLEIHKSEPDIYMDSRRPFICSVGLDF